MTLDRLLGNVAIRVEPFTLCLLSTGWCLRLPGPPDVMFHFVIKGSGVMRGPGGETHQLWPYCLGVVPPGVAHALECGSTIRSTEVIHPPPEGGPPPQLVAGSADRAELQVACGIVHVAYGDSLGLFSHLRDAFVADLSGYPQVRAAFEGILAEQASASPGGAALSAALMSQCLVYLLRHLSGAANPPLPWLSALDEEDLGRALDLMFENPAARHTVESLAEEALMSRSVFAERFHAAFGSSPMTFLRGLRMRRAAQLLTRSGALSIDQVAHRVGFSSRSHFSRAFREQFGMSPAAYRAGSAAEIVSQTS